MPMSHTSAVQSSREELIKLSQDIHSDVTKLMRNYTEGRDKLRVSLEQNVQKQQDSANFDLNNTYGQMNKVRINTTNETTIYNIFYICISMRLINQTLNSSVCNPQWNGRVPRWSDDNGRNRQ